MSRMGRLVLPDYPHHVVHRGHNKQDVFHGPQDHERYLSMLQEFRRQYAVKLYAYCLMTNHVHLLLAPATPTGIAQLMKRVAGRYTRYYNRRAGRTGTLWEGRYRSSLVERDSYLLACCRYIELNPVRAGLVADPRLYPWSSCAQRLGGSPGEWFDPDPCYVAMGRTADERRAGYAAFLAAGVPADQREFIRESLQRGHPTGGPRLTSEVSALSGKEIVRRGPGRPRKINLS
jgi:putative transposase